MEHQIFSKFVRFIEARLSPGGEFGLHLTAGLALLVAAAAVFGDLAEDVMGKEAITVLDMQVAHWFHAHAFEPLTSFMLGVSLAHTGYGMVVLMAALGWYFWRVQARYWLLALLVAVPSGALLNVALKYHFQRARPAFDEPLVSLMTYSFPSGHTSAATLFYGLLASYLVIARPHWHVRLGTALGCALMVLLVALSRVYLGAHYLSDVLAAMAESVAWLAVCITAISTLRRRREARTL
ncbi:phosphatase PAP2 family protein [Duganella violaceipulchra]|uniref:Phosphatase PAP2 family protein n=1 Tax=Duganella violaceipulchra TaxID=2849652 RepID=A0AA41H9R4_9BURK|nr:phosphatase PAP2 family protein [Duganella violaceicalia]MBV6324618.1 phosphatase PAP2 family protein [Duganella violaceicalia]MCP2009937.1 undecaprenyl-diphosphatase [Duganella violaceicalia]